MHEHNEKYFDGSLEFNAAVVMLVLVLGITGNGIVTHVYFKTSSHDAGNLLVLSLAMLDLTACYVLVSLKMLFDFHLFELNDVAYRYVSHSHSVCALLYEK